MNVSKAMLKILLLVSCLCFIAIIGTEGISTATSYSFPTSEFQALWEFYNVTNGPFWRWNETEASRAIAGIPWDFSNPQVNPCTALWEGIACQYNNNLAISVIEKIILPDHNITGTLPDCMANFQNLTVLTLPRNYLNGSLPSSIVQLENLLILDLQLNQLNGNLPINIGNLQRLVVLNASINMLSGSLPSSLFTLTHLTSLVLEGNALRGKISSEIKKLNRLESLRIDNNSFTGTIPSAICELFDLHELEISGNQLNGSIPSNIGQLKNLQYLQLDDNELTGSIPSSVGNLTNLHRFTANFNQLVGSFPTSMATLTKIELLNFEGNFLDGSLPDIWMHLTKLKVLALSGNLLTGSIPPSFQLLWKLTNLALEDNEFNGGVYNIFNNKTLSVAFLSDNQFEDNLATTLSVFGPIYKEFRELIAVGMESNYFQGGIGNFLEYSLRLRSFDIGENFLSNTIPTYFVALNHLNYLHLHDNDLTGAIPSFGALTPRLVVLSLAQNRLSGSIPSSFGQISSITELSLDGNQLVGKLPTTLVNCTRLQTFTAKQNQLTGPLVNFGVKNKLSNLDLSENFLTGTIPPSMFDIDGMETVIISNNCFHGIIPENICKPLYLVSLSMNGLSTATRCQRAIFPDIPDFTAFARKDPMDGSIPSCIFTMPSLTTLYLSGNGFRGSLPDDITISSSLKQMSLSYNLLDGSIPNNFAQHPWESLDLSYNEIGGTLTDVFYTFPVNTSLSLQVNRLSGIIPDSLHNSAKIDILEGNIFSCDFDKSQLPVNDPNRHSYSCGTDLINRAIYLWMGFTFLFVVTTLWFVRYYLLQVKQLPVKHGLQDVWREIKVLYEQGNSYMNQSSEVFSIHFHHLELLLDSIRQLFLWITIFAIVILLPLYAGLTSLDSIYTYTYAWEVSAILLSGVSSSIMLPIALSLVIIFIFLYFRFKVLPLVQSIEKILMELYPTLSSSLFPPSTSTDSTTSKATIGQGSRHKSTATFQPMVIKTTNPLEVVTCVLLGSFNFMLMVLVDVAYVIAIIDTSSNNVLAIQIFLSAFKIFWNELFLWKTYPVVKKWVINFYENRVAMSGKEDEASVIGTDTTLSTISSNPSGTERLSVASTPRDSNVNRQSITSGSRLSSFFRSSSFQQSHASITALLEEVNQKVVSRFQLRFLVYTGILNNVIIPTLAIAIVSPNCFHDAFFANTPSETTQIYTCDVVLAPGRNTYCVGEASHEDTVTYNIPFIYRYQCSSAFAINFTAVYIFMFIGVGFIIPLMKLLMVYLYYSSKPESALKRFSAAIMPRVFKELSAVPVKTRGKIFHRDKLVVRYSTYLAVLLSFGIPFPPLAIIIIVATYFTSYFEQFTIGKLLYDAHQAGYQWYMTLIEKESEGMASIWYDVLWIVLPFPSFIYGFLIFDTMGNVFGMKVAVVPFIFVICLGYILLFMRQCWVASNQVLISRIGSSRNWKLYLDEYQNQQAGKPVSHTTLSKLPGIKDEEDGKDGQMDGEKSRPAGKKVVPTTTVNNPILSYEDDNL